MWDWSCILTFMLKAMSDFLRLICRKSYRKLSSVWIFPLFVDFSDSQVKVDIPSIFERTNSKIVLCWNCFQFVVFCFSPALLKVRITMCRYWLQIDPPRVGDGHSIICGKASLSSHCRECHKHKNISKSRCTGSASKIDLNEYITTISLRALASLLCWDCVLCIILTTLETL